MKVIVFEQWDKLTALMRRIAAGSASEKSQYAIKRVQTKGGRAHLDDRTANVLAVEGGTEEIREVGGREIALENLREDVVKDSLPNQKIVSNVQSEGGYFPVKRVVK